jgi:carbamoyltransferase
MSIKLFPKNIPQESILGLNYSGMHDTAIALVSPDGKPIFALSLERISRAKQDGRHPDSILEGLPWERIAKVAISVEREYRPADDMSSRFHPTLLKSTLEGSRSHADSFLQSFDFIPVEKVFVPHHLCHAASSFWISGLSNATCLVYDGGMSNEEWFGGVFNASVRNGIAPIDQFSARNYSNVAHLYTAITAALGFTPLKHEGKITGLAAYGTVTNSCRKILEQWLHTPELLHGIVEWKDMYSQTTIPQLKPVPSFVQSVRAMLAKFTREEIAATVQKIAEEHITNILNEIIKQGAASENLCLSGGLFANVKINQRASELDFKKTFITPPMSDDGTALGAALQVASENLSFSPKPIHTMSIGPNYLKTNVEKFISKHNIKYQECNDSAKQIAKLLDSGSIVAVYQGAMEFGPRSLGNRSILTNANDPAINQELNNRLHRTEFMPFAPVCLDSDARVLFHDIDKVRHSAEFMTVTVNCSDEMKLLCPAVVHCDGTARPQLVTQKSNTFMHGVLSYYKELSGKPALVNTSFNVHEEPIVCTPEDAIKGFFESGLDVLYIEGYLIKLCENRDIEAEYLRKKIRHAYTSLITTKNKAENQEIQLHERDCTLKNNEDTILKHQSINQQLQNELDESKAQINPVLDAINQTEGALQEVNLQRQQLETQVQALQDEASQHDQGLREKETTQQELLLALMEKETKLQKATATLTDNKLKIDKLHASLTDSKAQQQTIKATLQETHQQRQQLETQVQALQDEASQHDQGLREKETTQQELLLALMEKETKLQEATTTISGNKQKIGQLYASSIDSKKQQQTLKTALKEGSQQRQRLETQVQTLHEEKTQLGCQLSKKEDVINWVNNEWDAAKHKVSELHQTNHHWWSMADQQSKELEEFRVKVDVLNHSSDHWRLETDRLNKDLQTIYNSMSWRITWPLRAVISMLRWLIMLPYRLLKWLLRPLAVSAMSHILRRPIWVMRLRGLKTRFPGLYAKMTSIARAHKLIGGAMPGTIGSAIQKDVLNVSSIGDDSDSNLKGPFQSLSPSAKAIYLDLLDLQLSSKNGEIK